MSQDPMPFDDSEYDVEEEEEDEDYGYSDPLGSLGRPRTPLASGLPPDAVQLLTKVMANGRETELGLISATASVYDVVKMWFDLLSQATGTTSLRFYPLDVAGQTIRMPRPIVIDISPAHLAFKEVRSERAQGIAAVAPVQVTPQQRSPLEVASYVDSKISAERARADKIIEENRRATEQRIREMLEARDKERAELAEERRILAEERVALTLNTSDKSHNLTMDLLEKNSARDAAAAKSIAETTSANTNTMMAMMQMMMQSQQNAANASLKEVQARADADRMRREDERRADRDAAAQRERDAEARHERDRVRDEAEQERRRRADEENHTRQLAFMKDAKQDDISKTITKVGGALAAVGLINDDTDLIGLVKGFLGGSAKAGLADAATGVVDKIVDGVIAVKKIEAANPEAVYEEPPPQVQQQIETDLVDVTYGDGTVQRMPRAQYDQLLLQQQQQQAAQQQYQQFQEPPQIPEGAEQTQNQVQQAPTPPQQAVDDAPRPAVPPPPRQFPTGLDAASQKAGRRAAKKIANFLNLHEDKSDESLLELALPVIIANFKPLTPLVKALSLKEVFTHAGMKDAFAERAIGLIDATGKLPADVPRRKEDL